MKKQNIYYNALLYNKYLVYITLVKQVKKKSACGIQTGDAWFHNEAHMLRHLPSEIQLPTYSSSTITIVILHCITAPTSINSI